MLESFASHWPEYLIEAVLLGTFMLSACAAVVLFQHPASPIRRSMDGSLARRACIGLLMGLTAIALIYSPLGARSGAHMNPGTTLAFLALGKVRWQDAVFYIGAQFLGSCLGVRLAALVLGPRVMHEAVNYAATTPGRGLRAAWVAEFAIAFGMMTMVLWSTNSTATLPYTGVFAGVLVAAFITIEAPISGMSMNPARTLGSAIPARAFRGLWVYFTAPPVAMLAAALLYTSIRGPGRVYCCKLNHAGHERCIFDCDIDELRGVQHAGPPRR